VRSFSGMTARMRHVVRSEGTFWDFQCQFSLMSFAVTRRQRRRHCAFRRGFFFVPRTNAETRLFTRLTVTSRVIFFVSCARFTVRRETSNFWATFFVFLHRLAAATRDFVVFTIFIVCFLKIKSKNVKPFGSKSPFVPFVENVTH
jgi:hypothetical protein